MICEPCTKAADFFSAAPDKEDLETISAAVLLHDECDNPATCPCLHRVPGKDKLVQMMLPTVLVKRKKDTNKNGKRGGK